MNFLLYEHNSNIIRLLYNTDITEIKWITKKILNIKLQNCWNLWLSKLKQCVIKHQITLSIIKQYNELHKSSKKFGNYYTSNSHIMINIIVVLNLFCLRFSLWFITNIPVSVNELSINLSVQCGSLLINI